MLAAWMEDIESLEEISQDDTARQLFLRMATLSQEGRLGPFLIELEADDELDAGTKGALVELAHDRTFLHAVESYLHSTHVVH